MRKEPKPRNAYAVSARFRKAGAHVSTNKKRGGKRGGSEASGIIEEQLVEYKEQYETTQEYEE